MSVETAVNAVAVLLAVASRAHFAPHLFGDKIATKFAPVFCGALSQMTPAVANIADGCLAAAGKHESMVASVLWTVALRYMRDEKLHCLRQLCLHTLFATFALLCASGGLGEPLVTQTERRRMVLYSWSWDGLARDIVHWGS